MTSAEPPDGGPQPKRHFDPPLRSPWGPRSLMQRRRRALPLNSSQALDEVIVENALGNAT